MSERDLGQTSPGTCPSGCAIASVRTHIRALVSCLETPDADGGLSASRLVHADLHPRGTGLGDRVARCRCVEDPFYAVLRQRKDSSSTFFRFAAVLEGDNQSCLLVFAAQDDGEAWAWASLSRFILETLAQLLPSPLGSVRLSDGTGSVAEACKKFYNFALGLHEVARTYELNDFPMSARLKLLASRTIPIAFMIHPELATMPSSLHESVTRTLARAIWHRCEGTRSVVHTCEEPAPGQEMPCCGKVRSSPRSFRYECSFEAASDTLILPRISVSVKRCGTAVAVSACTFSSRRSHRLVLPVRATRADIHICLPSPQPSKRPTGRRTRSTASRQSGDRILPPPHLGRDHTATFSAPACASSHSIHDPFSRSSPSASNFDSEHTWQSPSSSRRRRRHSLLLLPSTYPRPPPHNLCLLPLPPLILLYVQPARRRQPTRRSLGRLALVEVDERAVGRLDEDDRLDVGGGEVGEGGEEGGAQGGFGKGGREGEKEEGCLGGLRMGWKGREE